MSIDEELWSRDIEKRNCPGSLLSSEEEEARGSPVLRKFKKKKNKHLLNHIATYPQEVRGFEPPQEEVVPIPKGYTQLYGVDYEETFSPVADIRANRILISIAAYYDYEIWQMDVKTAFLNGYLDEDIYMVQPEGFVDPNHPKESEPHWTVVKNILKYLRNTKDMFLIYGGNPSTELRVECYCDAGFETAQDWKSSKQSTTAMSATESEYIAASEAAMEAVWIRKFISGLGIVPTINEPLNMY
ncbi:retrotransposon protein, putative, ty1-copia subclass [Tanacetum coccineum]